MRVVPTERFILTFTGKALERFRALPLERRHAVLERAAIIQESCGCTWEVADARALAEEGLRPKGGHR